MSPAPGVTVKDVEPTVPAGPATDVSTAFLSVLTERGPVGVALNCRIQTTFERYFGGPTSFGWGHTAARVMPGDGSGDVWYSRVVGPAAAAASGKLTNAASENCMEVTAANPMANSDPGEWGNSIKTQITVPEAGLVKVIVKLGTVVLEEFSGTRAEVILRAKSSAYIRLKELLASNPKAQEITLTGGTDDRSNITVTQWAAAEAAFLPEYGPGQLLRPGQTTKEARIAMLESAKARNRIVIPDAVDTHSTSTLVSGTAEVTSTTDPTLLACGFRPFGPWPEIESEAQGVLQTIPPSILVAARIAGHDVETYDAAAGVNDPNSPAAGKNGILTQVLGLSQEPWTNAEREVLAEGGINVIRLVYGQYRIYDYMTFANPLTDPLHKLGGNRRIDMAIKAKGDEEGEELVLGEIDSSGFALGDWGSALRAICNAYAKVGALYAEGEDLGYEVDVSEDVNPPKQLFEEEKARAVVKTRRAPMARFVEIDYTVEGVS